MMMGALFVVPDYMDQPDARHRVNLYDPNHLIAQLVHYLLFNNEI